MILVILAVSLIIGIVSIIACANDWLDLDEFWNLPGVIGFVGVIGSIITAIVLSINVSHLAVIDERIAMYEEENQRIEEQIAAAVSEYQSYETEIFTNTSNTNTESAITLVSLYPNLKADTLVQQQIETYVENNKTIRDLKDKAIKGSVDRWWLYFGY